VDASRALETGLGCAANQSQAKNTTPCENDATHQRWVVGYMYARPVEDAHLPGRTLRDQVGRGKAAARRVPALEASQGSTDETL
jgi:hypothetical protein